MTIKISKVNKQKPYLKLLVYGKPGAGKTLFAAGAADHPDLKDVLIINIEGGLMTINDKEVDAAEIGKNEKGENTNRTLEELETILWNIIAKQEGFAHYKTIVIDSATELQARSLEDVVADSKKKKPDRDVSEMTQNDYGKDSIRMRTIFRKLRDAPVNLIVTALAKSVVDNPKEQNAKVIEICPSLTAAVKESLMGYVDFVWYLYSDDKGVRRLLTQEQGLFRAKTRHPAFAQMIGSKVDNPNLPDLYSKLCALHKE
jgi:hypothetical protein